MGVLKDFSSDGGRNMEMFCDREDGGEFDYIYDDRNFKTVNSFGVCNGNANRASSVKYMENCENKVRIRYINIQGLTKTKIIEVEQLIQSENDVVVLVETQLKHDRIDVSENICKYDSMRDIEEKRGGGIMILYRNSQNLQMEKKESTCRDMLTIKMSIYNKDFLLIIVYFSVIQKETEETNEKIKREVEKLFEGEEEVIIVGDFNGHINGLGYQKQDRNGDMILEWINNNNMVLLNLDDKCEGNITWQRNEQKSVID